MNGEREIWLHINYFEQGASLEFACKKARELCVSGIEFRRTPFGREDEDVYLDEVSRALERYPLPSVCFGGPGVDLMSLDASEVARNLDNAEAFYREAARRFPLAMVNAFSGVLVHPDKTRPFVEYWHHGSVLASEKQWENAVNGFKRLAETAAEFDFRFAFETHGCYLHDTLDATLELIRRIDSPRVGMLWDQANLMIFPDSPTTDQVIEKANSLIYYVHLKNLLVSPSRFLAVSSLQGGIINIRQQVLHLLRNGYNGPLCVESPRDGDREGFLLEDLSYLRSLLPNVPTFERNVRSSSALCDLSENNPAMP